MKKDVQLQAVAERLDRVHKQMQNQMNSLSPRSRRIMTQIIESVLTFNQGRFFISMVSFKELSSNDKKQIYGLFPWMRKIRQFFAWGDQWDNHLVVDMANCAHALVLGGPGRHWMVRCRQRSAEQYRMGSVLLDKVVRDCHCGVVPKLRRAVLQTPEKVIGDGRIGDNRSCKCCVYCFLNAQFPMRD
ncbi:unnamed protein product [Toxocara canis]|uniref:Uncharacterized protein n=1 Tax=Toxocara canis TaxID=6265 RepID=A0A183VHA2_TOXCA|nr:unnamed protein product [Toxocara canis]